VTRCPTAGFPPAKVNKPTSSDRPKRTISLRAYGPPMSMSMSCRLGWHRFVTRSTEDGGRFRQCARCDKVDDRAKLPPIAGQGG
jgi:hypothetical protein